MFEPIHTRRLVIRPFVAEDADGLFARRNDPDVSRFQDWLTPFPRTKVDEIVTELLAMDGPQDEEWWMAAVCDAAGGEVLGDLAVHLGSRAKTAEVGYTFASGHWGRGYAVEALGALIDHLFVELEVTRVFGMLHPDNIASAMVLERCGLLFEGHTRSSFWLGDDCSDDWIYGMIRTDWEEWRGRPRATPDAVHLVDVTTDNYAAVSRLRTHHSQRRFVAPVDASYADALFPEVVDGAPVVPWMRAVEADGDLVGFVMLALRTDHHPEPFLWRLLIDRRHQRRGIGRVALDMVADECRRHGSATLLTSWVDGKGSPAPFYTSYGFTLTGELIDDEIVGRLHL